MFQLFADLIGFHLDARDSEAALLSERETAELRERFIAVLGHDLRNRLRLWTPASAFYDELRWMRPGHRPSG